VCPEHDHENPGRVGEGQAKYGWTDHADDPRVLVPNRMVMIVVAGRIMRAVSVRVAVAMSSRRRI
jgi:hypothetical protein